ncbi:AbfB domain-containing protein [Streptosporangium sp. NBC_01469]|uniref:AbfB domain-containing protein n=1 Tax=Streptosporangium sp. NBC_01469 TaxID=2903898 RepID=UPI002E2C67B5|nr:AbfB domain-containing protein [Streptosporangium sp. NBC_01469]
MSLSRRQFGKAALTSAAPATTGVVGFPRVAGLADGNRSSFRSHDFPPHHLRHQGYVLRIDPISSSSSAADHLGATFRVIS